MEAPVVRDDSLRLFQFTMQFNSVPKLPTYAIVSITKPDDEPSTSPLRFCMAGRQVVLFFPVPSGPDLAAGSAVHVILRQRHPLIGDLDIGEARVEISALLKLENDDPRTSSTCSRFDLHKMGDVGGEPIGVVGFCFLFTSDSIRAPKLLRWGVPPPKTSTVIRNGAIDVAVLGVLASLGFCWTRMSYDIGLVVGGLTNVVKKLKLVEVAKVEAPEAADDSSFLMEDLRSKSFDFPFLIG